jgi:predicted Ser/Thr protein kinase
VYNLSPITGNRGVVYTAQLLDSSGSGLPVRVAVKEPLHERYLKSGRTAVLTTASSGSGTVGGLQQVDFRHHFGGSGCSTYDGESAWLSVLNPYGLGPRLLYADSGRIVTSFADGPRILDYLAHEPSLSARCSTVAELLRQARRLDALGVHKGEFIRPDRHVLVVPSDIGPQVILLDFERCRTMNPPAMPKNVAQLCQFLSSPRFITAAAGPRPPLQGENKCCEGQMRLDVNWMRELVRKYQTRGQIESDYAVVEQFFLAVLSQSAQPLRGSSDLELAASGPGRPAFPEVHTNTPQKSETCSAIFAHGSGCR